LKVNKCGTRKERNKEKRRRNLANNMGGKREDKPWVLGTLIYEAVTLER